MRVSGTRVRSESHEHTRAAAWATGTVLVPVGQACGTVSTRGPACTLDRLRGVVQRRRSGGMPSGIASRAVHGA